MTKERFMIADLHLGHEKILTFSNRDGTRTRDFESVDHMHDHMVEKWNAVVREQDVVYILGDCAIKQPGLEVLKRMKGSKRLIAGNHDIFRTKKYLEYFKEVRACSVQVDRFIMSHIPLHPDSITHRFKANVHGHLHANQVMKEFQFVSEYKPQMFPDPRYLCVSVEQPHINYTPIHFDDAISVIKERFKNVGWEYPENKTIYEEEIS